MLKMLRKESKIEEKDQAINTKVGEWLEWQ